MIYKLIVHSEIMDKHVLSISTKISSVIYEIQYKHADETSIENSSTTDNKQKRNPNR